MMRAFPRKGGTVRLPADYIIPQKQRREGYVNPYTKFNHNSKESLGKA